MQKCFRISSDFNAVSNKNLPKSHLSLLCEQVLKDLGYDVIAIVKKTSKVFYEYNGEMMSVCDIYKANKKRRCRSKYLLSVNVNVVKNDTVVPAKIVFVRNRNKRSDYLCILSTDTAITEEEIIRIYGKRKSTLLHWHMQGIAAFLIRFF